MNIFKSLGLVLSVTVPVFIVSFAVLAFTYPAQAPTGGNVALPINDSNNAQLKIGSFEVGGVFRTNSITQLARGNVTSSVEIGSSSTSSNLIVHGYIVGDGSQLTGISQGGIPSGGSFGATLMMGNDGPFWNSPLTWSDTNQKYVYDCEQIGGTVYDTGASGTICKYPGSTIPEGWSQAANWQEYTYASWGGDICGRYKSSAPVMFSNSAATCRVRDGNGVHESSASLCTNFTTQPLCNEKPHLWYGSLGRSTFWCPDVSGNILHLWYGIITTSNCSTNRISIGIY